MAGGAKAAARWLWLPPAVAAVVVWPVCASASETEAGSRAGAEPGMAAIFAGAPFVLLALAQLSCAASAQEDSRASVVRCLVGSTVAAALVVALLLALLVLHARAGYDWTDLHGVHALVLAVGLAPVPVWWALRAGP